MKVSCCFVLLICCFKLRDVFCKKMPPLLEERGHRKVHLTSECLFGKQHKELGSSWYADLGPPFDVMYCIKCECLKVVKEGRIYGHTKCKNIAKDCQELTCEDQIQVPGRCCKVCRNDSELTETLQDITVIGPSEEEERSHKHYAALLTSTFYTLHRDSSNGTLVNSVGQSATGRFTLHKRNLYYSFYVTVYPLPTRPKMLQFVDNYGNILEEQQIASAGSLYQNLTGKLCGVWRRVPGEYRTLLKEEKLSVVLIWEEYDVKIRGALLRYVPLPTELFSSLMVSSNDSLTDAAGTAIISISTVTPAVHVMVVFTGLLNMKRKYDNQVTLKLFADNEETTIFEKKISIEKPSPELNVITYGTAVTWQDLLALSKQHLSVSLTSGFGESNIRGKVLPRVQCELHQAVLSSSHQNQANMTYPKKSTKASGLAWMFIDRNSALRYYLILDNVADVSVELVTARHLNLVGNLSDLGYPNGPVSLLHPKYLEQLYDDELAVNVVKMNSNNPSLSLIRGRLVSRPVADSRDSITPYLLKRSDISVPADMVGLMWARVDMECNLHYDISVTGKDVEDHPFELYLEDIPFLAPGAPVTRRLLEEFSGSSVEGFSFALSQHELARLETSVVFLDIWDMKRGQSVLRTRWDKLMIPENCLPRNVDNSTADNNIPSQHLISDDNEPPEILKCFHGSQFYEHGTQWTSTVDSCTMCNCNHGITKCDVVLCPDLNCSQKFTVPGSCCPSCSNISLTANVTHNCTLGGQQYTPGSAWYPYIPPSGFATCTVCHCDANTLQVKCNRVECPPLTCDEKLAFKPEKKSCCKVCPNKTRTIAYDLAVSDQQNPVKYERDILMAGGCKYPYGGPYENGKEWNPRIYFHGIEKCVTCRCKDGKVSCERKKCTKQTCEDPCCMKKTRCNKPKRSQEELGKRERI